MDEPDITEADADCIYHEPDCPDKNIYHISMLFNKCVPVEEIALKNRLGVFAPYASNPIKISDLS